MSRYGIRLTVLLAIFAGCGDEGCTATIDEDAIVCSSDSQCDDGLYCNGIETCAPDDPFASRFGCVAGQVCRTDRRFDSSDVRCDEEEVASCFEEGGDRDACCTALCQNDNDCDDRVFCNGQERCNRRAEGADSNGCVQSDEPCVVGTEICDEEIDMCVVECADADGDGVESAACGGGDCDDSDNRVAQGFAEVCDEDGVDEDCNPNTLGPDEDGDGYVPLECCNGDECGSDCDDRTATLSPGVVEVCNGRDDNCDGDIDEGVRILLYRDADGDGFGVSSDTTMGCAGTADYAIRGGDCDDGNPQIFPGSIVCDPLPNSPNAYQFCEPDGTYSPGQCDPQTEACVEQPGGHGVCTRP